MNEMIKRYVYDVTRRLPEASREEVKQELYANIADMLGENPSQHDIEEVLLSLGHPRVLANQYREKQRYLISPEWMDDYLLVLKIVLIVFAALAAIGGVLDRLLDPQQETLIGLIFATFFGTIGDIFSALITGFGIVTLIFIGIDRGTKETREVKFRLKDLPKVPTPKTHQIKRTETIISLILTIIFGGLLIYVFYHNATVIGWYEADGGFQMIAAFFNDDVIQMMLPFIIVSIVFSVLMEALKLTSNEWTISLAAIQTFVKIFAVVVGIVFVTQPDLINPLFITEVEALVNEPGFDLANIFQTLKTVIAVLMGIGAAIEIATLWVKTLKSKPQTAAI